MGILDAILGKKVSVQIRDENGILRDLNVTKKEFRELQNAGKISYCETITAHILDPNTGYSKQNWVIGIDVEAELVQKFAKNGMLFVVLSYEKGKPQAVICRHDVWDQAKAQFEAIDESSAASLEEIRNRLRERL